MNVRYLKKTRIYYWGLIICAMFLIFSTNVSVQAASKIKLNKTRETIFVGESSRLKLNDKKKKCTWSSADASIATVSATGKVTGKKIGTTYIYAKVGGKRLICKVNVKSIWKAEKQVFYICKGETAKIKVDLEVNSLLRYSVGNEDVLYCKSDTIKNYGDNCGIVVTVEGKNVGETCVYFYNGYTKEKYRITVIVSDREDPANHDDYVGNYDKLKYYMETKNTYTDTDGTKVISEEIECLDNEVEATLYIRYSPKKNIFTFEYEILREDDAGIYSSIEIDLDKLPYVQNEVTYIPDDTSAFSSAGATLKAKINITSYGKNTNKRYTLDSWSKSNGYEEYSFQELCNQSLKRLISESDTVLSGETGMHMRDLGFLAW